MGDWYGFASAAPVLAATAQQLLHGRVAYLATTRRDGSPRVHPVTPFIGDRELFVFMEPTSPKGRDLVRDPRYQLHAGVQDPSGRGGELYVRGAARPVIDAVVWQAAVAACPYEPADRYVLFTLGVDEAMLTTYADTGTVREKWREEGL